MTIQQQQDNSKYSDFTRYNKLYNSIRKKYGKKISKMELDSCINDGYVLALRDFSDAKSNGKSFERYLYQRIEWKCFAFLKKESRRRKIQSNYISDTYGNANANTNVINFSYSEHNHNFEAMIEGLCDQSKKLLRMRFIDNKTFQEISSEFNCSRETARKRIIDILSKLKEERCI